MIRKLLLLACLLVAANASAALYNITYTDGQNTGQGVINVVGNNAVSGSFTVTAGVAIGNWNLSPGAGSDGSFYWDNLVNPASNPFLSVAGLLFKGTGANSAYEINIWGNGVNDYAMGGNIGGNWNPLVNSGGTATLTPVPEPSTWFAGLGSLGLLVSGLKCRSRRA